jgi:hypothetical protein
MKRSATELASRNLLPRANLFSASNTQTTALLVVGILFCLFMVLVISPPTVFACFTFLVQPPIGTNQTREEMIILHLVFLLLFQRNVECKFIHHKQGARALVPLGLVLVPQMNRLAQYSIQHRMLLVKARYPSITFPKHSPLHALRTFNKGQVESAKQARTLTWSMVILCASNNLCNWSSPGNTLRPSSVERIKSFQSKSVRLADAFIARSLNFSNCIAIHNDHQKVVVNMAESEATYRLLLP